MQEENYAYDKVGIQAPQCPIPVPLSASNVDIEINGESRSNTEQRVIEVGQSQSESDQVEVVQHAQGQKPTGISWPFLMMTLLGTRLGAGIVGIPYATKTVGYVFAVIFQSCFLVPAGMLSIWFLLTARQLTNKGSLTELGQYCFGNGAIYAINAIIALAQLGYPIIFFIVFGDVAGALIEKAHGGKSFWSSRWFTQILLGLCLVYLIIQKDISKLKVAGLFILCFITVFMILFFIDYLILPGTDAEEVKHEETIVSFKFFASIPTFLTVYTFQTTLFPAFATLKVKTKINGQLADFCGRIIAFIIYNASPLIAFAIFKEKVEKNMLKSIANQEGALPVVLMFIFLVIAVMHIPLIFYTGKEALLIMIEEFRHGSYSQRNWWKEHRAKEEAKAVAKLNGMPSAQNNRDNEELIHAPTPPSVTSSVEEVPEEVSPPPTNMKAYLNMGAGWYYGVTLSAFALVVLISIVVEDVSVFFGIIGSLSGCFCTFIASGGFYVFSIKKTNTPVVTFKEKLLYCVGWIFFVGGITVALALLTCVFFNAAGL